MRRQLSKAGASALVELAQPLQSIFLIKATDALAILCVQQSEQGQGCSD